METKAFQQSLVFKIIIIGLLMLVLLIPLAMIASIVGEREKRRGEAVTEVSAKWGTEQTIAGPVMIVPYRAAVRDEHNAVKITTQYACILPDSLVIEGGLAPERRWRGLYEVILYHADGLRLSGRFRQPDLSLLGISPGAVLWRDAVIVIGITDMRGLRDRVSLSWNGRAIPFEAGTRYQTGLFKSGMHARLNAAGPPAGTADFNCTLNIRGSSTLGFIPLSEEIRVRLRSSWAHPSFTGAYLPSQRSIDHRGFSATWLLSNFGRNYPQSWTSQAPADADAVTASSFGVQLFQPVDFYQACVRAAKYGALFILLTFLAFFLSEVFLGLNIHPLQYLMVGAALCLFYLLFLALSEHISFVPSYLLASAGTIGLIAAYSAVVLGGHKHGLVMAGLLGGLYAYLYVLLRNEDYALLIGSLGLFAILGSVMFITRRVDWYRLRFNGTRAREKGAVTS